MKKYLKIFIALTFLNVIGLTAMEPELQKGASDQGQLCIFPNELLLPILNYVFFNSTILIDSDNIFDAMNKINPYLSKSLIDILLTCKLFSQLQNDFLKLKPELLKFYQSKLKEIFLERRQDREGLYPKKGEWIDHLKSKQETDPFLSTESDNSFNSIDREDDGWRIDDDLDNSNSVNQLHGREPIAHMVALFFTSEDQAGYPILSETICIIFDQQSKIQLIHLLIFFGADLNAKDYLIKDTPLIKALRIGDKEVVKIFLAKNANINLQDRHGDTALILTMNAGEEELKRALSLKKPDKVEIALIRANYNRCKEVTEMILAKNPDLNIQNNVGDTALIIAARNGEQELVKLLLAKKPDINIQNNYGDTALIVAANSNDKKIAQLILAANPDINIRNYSGKTALAIAEENGHKSIASMLKKHQNVNQGRCLLS